MKIINMHTEKLVPGMVRVDRQTRFGNPFVAECHTEAEHKRVVNLYRRWITTRPYLVEAAKLELRGKDLACWCKPLPCHADVLLEIANSDFEANPCYSCTNLWQCMVCPNDPTHPCDSFKQKGGTENVNR